MYNADQMPPGSQPGNKNISGFRTRSTQGGGDHNANVLTFDDTMGSEVFYMRAEKDMAVRVENNEDSHVYNNQTITVDNDRTETVTNGNESVTIKGAKGETGSAPTRFSATIRSPFSKATAAPPSAWETIR